MRSEGRRILKGTVFLNLSSGINMFLAFLLNIVLVKALGLDDFGRYALTTALFSVVSVIVENLHVSAIKQGDDALSSLPLVAALQASVAVVILILALGAAALGVSFKGIPIGLYLSFLSLGLLFMTAGRYLETRLTIERSYGRLAAFQSLGEVLRVGGISLGGLVLGLPGTFAGYAAGRLLHALVALALGGRLIRFNPDPRLLSPLLRDTGLFALTGMMKGIFWRLDEIILGFFFEPRLVGIYRIASVVARPLTFTISPLSTVLFAEAARSSGGPEGPEWNERVLTKGTHLLSIIIVPLIAVSSFIIGPLVSLFFGPEVAAAAPVFVVVLWAFGASAAVSAAAPILRVLRNDLATAFTVLLVAINLVLDLLFIPDFSILGAALASFFAQAVTALLVHRTALAAGASGAADPIRSPGVLARLFIALALVAATSSSNPGAAGILLILFVMTNLEGYRTIAGVLMRRP